MNRIKYPDTVEIINHNPDDLQDITNDIRIKLSARDDDKEVEGHEKYSGIIFEELQIQVSVQVLYNHVWGRV